MGALDDERWMTLAATWARRGLGATYPNPSVGAVVVARGQLVGAGRSAATGGPHAEVRALAQAGRKARGASLYVTLEPCCHTGRTGPCTEAILAAGIRRVVVGVADPAPHVGGKGIRWLRRHGVEVTLAPGGRAGPRVHEHYLHHVATARPFVTLKAAASLDGKVAVASGASRWITGEASRRDGHRLRAQHHAIAVGWGTVAADDPALTVRHVRGVDPVVVLFDTHLRCADKARALPRLLRPGTLVLHGPGAPSRAIARLRDAQAEPLEVGLDGDGHVDVAAALEILGTRPIRSLLVEGGGRLLGSFVAGLAWQRIVLYQAPRLLGEGPSWIQGPRWESVDGAPQVTVTSRRLLGEDLRVEMIPRGDGGASPGASKATGRGAHRRVPKPR